MRILSGKFQRLYLKCAIIPKACDYIIKTLALHGAKLLNYLSKFLGRDDPIAPTAVATLQASAQGEGCPGMNTAYTEGSDIFVKIYPL